MAAKQRPGIYAPDGSLYITLTDGAGNLASTTSITAYTVATLPTVGTAGRMAYVTDATTPTFLTTIVGGGAVKCPVFDNGTNWVAF